MPVQIAMKHRLANKNLRSRLPVAITSVVLAIIVILIIIMNLRDATAITLYNSDTITYDKGTVTAVLDERLTPAPEMPGRELGYQKIRVRLKSGVQKGQIIEFDNNLSTTHSIRVNKGSSVIVKADRPQAVTPFYTLYNYDHTPGLFIVAAIFIACILLVGAFKGLRSVLGLGISLFFILAFMIPAIYHGYSPVWISVLTVIIIASFSLLLLNGFGKKTLIAVAATISGVAVSALFFFAISAILHLSGYDISEAEELIVLSQRSGLQIGQVLFAGVLISSLGAVIDTTISISASLYEMKEMQPTLSRQALFKSGMAVGRDMMGAHCQTLILAYVGSSLATLLVLISYGTQFEQFLSSNYVAIEVVQGITGSIAVIVSVPITAALCMMFSSQGTHGTLATRERRRHR